MVQPLLVRTAQRRGHLTDESAGLGLGQRPLGEQLLQPGGVLPLDDQAGLLVVLDDVEHPLQPGVVRPGGGPRGLPHLVQVGLPGIHRDHGDRAVQRTVGRGPQGPADAVEDAVLDAVAASQGAHSYERTAGPGAQPATGRLAPMYPSRYTRAIRTTSPVCGACSMNPPPR
jgi:hypothetical protein